MPEESPEYGGGHTHVNARLALISVAIAGSIATVLRMRNGNTGTPPARGGWTELSPEDIDLY